MHVVGSAGPRCLLLVSGCCVPPTWSTVPVHQVCLGCDLCSLEMRRSRGGKGGFSGSVLNRFSCDQLSVTLWTEVRQVPLSTELSRQEYWSGQPCPTPGDLPDPGIEDSLPSEPPVVSKHCCGAVEKLWLASRWPQKNNLSAEGSYREVNKKLSPVADSCQ